MPHGRRLRQIFEAVLTNKPFILNAYHSISREQIENYLFKLTYALIADVVREQAEGTGLSEDATKFIADFYKYSFVGVMLDWIKQGMKADYDELVDHISTTMHGNIFNSIQNFTKQGK